MPLPPGVYEPGPGRAEEARREKRKEKIKPQPTNILY